MENFQAFKTCSVCKRQDVCYAGEAWARAAVCGENPSVQVVPHPWLRGHLGGRWGIDHGWDRAALSAFFNSRLPQVHGALAAQPTEFGSSFR